MGLRLGNDGSRRFPYFSIHLRLDGRDEGPRTVHKNYIYSPDGDERLKKWYSGMDTSTRIKHTMFKVFVQTGNVFQTLGESHMRMKIKLFIVLCTLCAAGAWAEPKGWGLGAGTFDGDFGVQARKDFMFGDELQYAVDLQAGLYNQRKWTGRFNADFHYVFMSQSAFSLYPLAGANLALQDGRNRWGANIGGGALLDLNDATSLFLEAKYVAGDWSGYAITVGVYF